MDIGSEAGSLTALLPVLLVGGSVAGIVIALPQIQLSVAEMGIVLPPLPGMPTPPPPPVAEAPPAPGPEAPNGRGGEGGTSGGDDVIVANTVTVSTGSLGDFEFVLPDGMQLPPLPFIR